MTEKRLIMCTQRYRRLITLICCAVCTLLIGRSGLQLHATEGVEYTTFGDWNSPSKAKPWSYNGENRYGTAGYHFYNVTPIGGERSPKRPTDENLKSSLPSYIKSITPVEHAFTSHSFNYLAIDAPEATEPAKLESGLLALPPNNTSNDPAQLLTIELGEFNDLYGFRIGILIANADRAELSPRDVILSTPDNRWNRSVVNLPDSNSGMWVFFNISAEHANSKLILSIRPPSTKMPAAIGGLVFDDLVVAPPEQPLNVISEKAVSQYGSVVWDASPVRETIAEEDSAPWEHSLAMKLSENYRQNESRLEAIEEELKHLPSPYTGEPTGTGGYLSHWVGSNKNHIEIHFRWDEPVSIDAVALLPLRLFLADGDGLTNNAYWPNTIEIHALDHEKEVLLETVTQHKYLLQQSLPELATFKPHTTQHLKITLRDLAQKNGSHQYTGGFSEICIFSNLDNIAPRASISANRSREGFRVFSRNYLTDGQTPLGLPEIGPRTSSSLGLSIRPGYRTPEKPVNIKLTFDEVITLDTVRIDPAVIYKPGQAFPVRFTIDLLNPKGEVIHSDLTHRDDPLRNRGLNPYFSYFPETAVKAVRIRVYELSQPTTLSRPWIQISEVTPIHKGKHIQSPASISAPTPNRKQGQTEIFDPTGRRLYWQNEFVYDGQTQAGRALPLREWIEGLYTRKQLLIERLELESEQSATLKSIHRRTFWSALIFITVVVVIALYLIIYTKVSNRQALRSARERIASDLHDDVGSNLGSITLHTEVLMDQIETPSLKEHLRSITTLTRESVYGLREVLHTSAPRIGRAQNILHYMEELSHLVLTDVDVSLHLAPSINRELKSPQRRKGVILYFKEAITNIRTHAQCQHVSVTMHQTEHDLELIIEDDGIGMSPETLSKQSTLRTLRLRANEMRASLNIISKVNQGTRLELKIPLR